MADINPLNWQIPIVNANGTPTDEFQRAWTGLRSATGTIPALDTQSEVSAVLDKIGATPGSLLHRTAAGWEIITGANGDLLKRGAANWQVLPSPADPTQFLAGDLTWQTPATGGGGDLYTMSAGNATPSVSTTAFATKGCSLTLVDTPIDISKIYATLDTLVNGSQFTAHIGTGVGTIASIIASSNPTTWNTGDDVTVGMEFPTPVTLTPGVRYILLVSWTNAASGSTALRMVFNSALTLGRFPGVITTPTPNIDGLAVASTTPVAGNSIATNTNGVAIGFRYTR